jgi:hypothetical protein|tara:strand:+ start:326 stop:1000 length:675 start_codon:yes stop_codon:yes gene_type:complete
MTRAQMHKEFKFLMDKVDSASNPLFLEIEIDRLLNISQDKFITKRAFGNNVRRTSFEEDQKRRDDLRTLIAQENISTSTATNAKPNAQHFELPADYRHSINEEAFIKTNGDATSGRRVSVKPITHDRYNKIIDDPFNKPDINTVYRLGFGDGGNICELIHGENQTIDIYYLRYLKVADEISGSQEPTLPLHTHREIVRMAVVEALEGIESQRYQSSKIELNEIE